MRRWKWVTWAATVFGSVELIASANGIAFGQFDTFQDGTTMNWGEGGFTSSPNPPTNVANGGPAGTGDRYLQNVSGGFSAGSRMIMFNFVQWTGNYNAAGVDQITAQMANFGSTTLHMRIAIRGGPFESVYGSTVAAQLPPDGVWRPVTFDLTPSALTLVSGPENSLPGLLDDVIELRILSAANGPAYRGDTITGTLGVDNIIARDIANFIFRITQVGFVSGAPRVTFTTLANRNYRVERKNALTDTDWVALPNATNVPGTGNEVQVTDTEPGAANLPHRFYRAVLLPP